MASLIRFFCLRFSLSLALIYITLFCLFQLCVTSLRRTVLCRVSSQLSGSWFYIFCFFRLELFGLIHISSYDYGIPSSSLIFRVMLEIVRLSKLKVKNETTPPKCDLTRGGQPNQEKEIGVVFVGVFRFFSSVVVFDLFFSSLHCVFAFFRGPEQLQEEHIVRNSPAATPVQNIRHVFVTFLFCLSFFLFFSSICFVIRMWLRSCSICGRSYVLFILSYDVILLVIRFQRSPDRCFLFIFVWAQLRSSWTETSVILKLVVMYREGNWRCRWSRCETEMKHCSCFCVFVFFTSLLFTVWSNCVSVLIYVHFHFIQRHLGLRLSFLHILPLPLPLPLPFPSFPFPSPPFLSLLLLSFLLPSFPSPSPPSPSFLSFSPPSFPSPLSAPHLPSLLLLYLPPTFLPSFSPLSS